MTDKASQKKSQHEQWTISKYLNFKNDNNLQLINKIQTFSPKKNKINNQSTEIKPQQTQEKKKIDLVYQIYYFNQKTTKLIKQLMELLGQTFQENEWNLSNYTCKYCGIKYSKPCSLGGHISRSHNKK